jgi:hypothetical protein
MPDLQRLALELKLSDLAWTAAHTILLLDQRHPHGAWFNEFNRLVGKEMHLARRAEREMARRRRRQGEA